VIEGWVTGKHVAILGQVHLAPRVVGPDANLSAVVTELNSDNGIVMILNGERETEEFRTRTSETEQTTMIILEPGYDCIAMGNSSTKYVKKSPRG
jgi:hypothetical protein